MDIKLSLIEGDSPCTSRIFENQVYAADFLDLETMTVPTKSSAYQPFFATDLEIDQLNNLIDQNSLYRFYQVEGVSSGISKYNLRVNSERMSNLGSLFISDFYEHYFEHVAADLQLGVNNRFSWLNALHLGLIKKLDVVLKADLKVLQNQCLKEASELEKKLTRSLVGTSYEDAKSERKTYLKLRICLNRNLANGALETFSQLKQEIKSAATLDKSLQTLIRLFSEEFRGCMNKFIKRTRSLKIEKSTSKRLDDNIQYLLSRAKPKPLDTLNSQLNAYFGSCEAANMAFKNIMVYIKANIKTLARIKTDFNRELDVLVTQVIISLVGEQFENIFQLQKAAQKTFSENLSELKNALKEKLHVVNALIRKKNRQMEVDDVKEDAADPEFQKLLLTKKEYEQKIQYEDYIYNNKMLNNLSKQFKQLKRCLRNIPFIYGDADATLEQIVSSFHAEISRLNDFSDAELQDNLVFNTNCNQYQTINFIYSSFYEDRDLQAIFQKLCVSHAYLKYYTQITDFYYSLNSRVKNPSVKGSHETAYEAKIETQVNFHLNQVNLLELKINRVKTTDLLSMPMNPHDMFFIVNWVKPIKIDRCCSLEQKTDFSKYLDHCVMYRSEFFEIINKRLLNRKKLKGSWFVSHTKRIELEGQAVDLLQFMMSPQFWSVNPTEVDPIRVEVARSFNAKTLQLNTPDVIYLNLSAPSFSSYQKVVKHIATSMYKILCNNMKEMHEL